MTFEKKLSINNNIEILHIPVSEEIDNIWYTENQLKKIRREALIELNVFATLKNITIKDAVKQIYK